MIFRHDDLAIPVVARHEQQVAEQVARARRDREIDFVGRDHVGNLFGGALVQVQIDPRVSAHENRE